MANDVRVLIKAVGADVVAKDIKTIGTAASTAAPHIEKAGKGTKDLGDKATAAHGPLGGLSKALGDVGKIAAGFVVGAGLMKLPGLFSGFIGGASDLNESLSKSNTVFGDNAKVIENWANSAATSLGMSKGAALEAASTFGNFLQAMGATQPMAVDMSKAMVQLATDLGSFNNASPDEVLLALRSGLSGEAEPMRKFGVALSETAVKAEAAKLHLGGLGRELTEQEKIQARYSLIMQQTTMAQGDFARTSDGLANQMKILKAQWADASAQLGTALLPSVVAVAGALIKMLPTIIDIGSALGGVALDAIKDFAAAVIPLVEAGWDKISGPLATLAGLAWDGLVEGVAQLKALASTAAELAAAGVPEILSAIGEASAGFWSTDVLPKLEAFRNILRDDVVPVLQDKFLPALKDTAQSLGNLLGGAVQTATNFLSAHKEVMLAVVAAYVAWKAALIIGEIVSLIATAAGLTAAFIAMASAEGILTASQVALNIAMTANPIGAVAVAVAALVAVGIILYKNWDDLEQKFPALATATDAVKTALEAVTSVVQPLVGWLGEHLLPVVGKLIELYLVPLKLAFEGIKTVIEEGVLPAFDKVGEIVGKVDQFMGEAKDKVIEVGGEIISAAVTIGKQIVEGLWDGIDQLRGWLWDKVTAWAGSIKDAAMSALEIGSPSKVFYQIGVNVVKGFDDGMQSEAPAVFGKWSGTFDDWITTTKAQVANAFSFAALGTLKPVGGDVPGWVGVDPSGNHGVISGHGLGLQPGDKKGAAGTSQEMT